MMRDERPTGRLGLALGGGGARGLCHIGVWRVLEELRKLEEPPPVILTTGSIEATEDCDYPRIELLRKPFRLGELEEALQRAMAEPTAP